MPVTTSPTVRHRGPSRAGRDRVSAYTGPAATTATRATQAARATTPAPAPPTITDQAPEVTTVTTARFSVPTSGPARVLHQIRTVPGITRARLHDDLGLSQPTVTRHVSALIDAGLVEQASPDPGAAAIGRPGSTLLPDGRDITALGAHVGLRSTQLIAVDGAGRPLRSRTLRLPLPDLDPDEALEAVHHGLATLGRGLPRPVGLGVAFSAHVNALGHISSAAYGWEDVDVAEKLVAAGSPLPDVPVALSTGVSAMAGAELSSTVLASGTTDAPAGRIPGTATARSTLYVYARELVAHAWIVGDAVHQPFTGAPPAAFTALAESGSFAASRNGIGHPLGTTAVLNVARERGLEVSGLHELVALSDHDSTARDILDERAELLGQMISLAVDVVDPASVVFAGEAFTADPRAVKIIAGALNGGDHRSAGGSAVPRRRLSIQRAGDGILARAASVTALHQLWSDPLGTLG
ncbi:MarR family transcriptional regulator [Corynebacterium nuruki]|uniref:ROK family transcriptional regulator n=1 Tax=Corynebacterium nuruki TaxID=1032851 RepID=A0A3D4T0R0_9CORY|nr:MarR family transcriptional regulator [Corynebacterium nuruki]HCT15122.1 ROK family transcriptional regulator [Corynebacterium nuruki]